jgi:hypothetical protein
MYNFKAEELNNCSKEELIKGIMEFGNVVNTRIAGLNDCLKSRPQDPSLVDVDSEEFNNVYQHDKIRFEQLGINKSAMLSIQKCLMKSKTMAMEKHGLYTTYSEEYHNACIKQYSLSMIEDSMKKAINSQAALDTQKDHLRLAAIALKKQQQQIRLERASISMDDWHQTNNRYTLENDKPVEIVDIDDGDDEDDEDNGGYNNGIDTHMHEN